MKSLTYPDVYVVMPALNVERWIAPAIGALRGVCNVVVVDDGSTDGTRKLIQSIPKDFDFAPLFNNANTPGGTSAARNAGIELILEQRAVDPLHRDKDWFVAFVDADDVALPGFVPRLRDAILTSAEECVGAYCDVAIVDERNRSVGWNRRSLQRCELVDLLRFVYPPLTMSSVMFRGSVFETGMRFDPDWQYGQDFELCARLLATTAKGFFTGVDEPLLQYRRRAGQATANGTGVWQAYARVMVEYCGDLGLSDHAAMCSNAAALLDAWNVSAEGMLTPELGSSATIDRRLLAQWFRDMAVSLDGRRGIPCGSIALDAESADWVACSFRLDMSASRAADPGDFTLNSGFGELPKAP